MSRATMPSLPDYFGALVPGFDSRYSKTYVRLEPSNLVFLLHSVFPTVVFFFIYHPNAALSTKSHETPRKNTYNVPTKYPRYHNKIKNPYKHRENPRYATKHTRPEALTKDKRTQPKETQTLEPRPLNHKPLYQT